MPQTPITAASLHDWLTGQRYLGQVAKPSESADVWIRDEVTNRLTFVRLPADLLQLAVGGRVVVAFGIASARPRLWGLS
jgi:hypothetical protein